MQKGMKTLEYMEKVGAFSTMKTIGIHRKNVNTGSEPAEEFRNICKAESLQIYYIKMETKNAFAERTN